MNKSCVNYIKVGSTECAAQWFTGPDSLLIWSLEARPCRQPITLYVRVKFYPLAYKLVSISVQNVYSHSSPLVIVDNSNRRLLSPLPFAAGQQFIGIFHILKLLLKCVFIVCSVLSGNQAVNFFLIDG